MGRLLVATTIAWLIVLAACGGDPAPLREWTPADHGQPPGADPSRIPPSERDGRGEPAPAESDAEASARAARALFNLRCAGCHGRDARGGGPGAPPGTTVPDLTAPGLLASRSDEALVQVIVEGRGLMPAFGKEIRNEGIVLLVSYLRGLAANAAGPGATAAAVPDEGNPTPPAEDNSQ